MALFAIKATRRVCNLRRKPAHNQDSEQTPSQGKASSDRFDPGSSFLPCFGRVVWAKAAMLHIYGLASVWEVPCSRLTGGDGHARLSTGPW